jgi:competence protein ComEC
VRAREGGVEMFRRLAFKSFLVVFIIFFCVFEVYGLPVLEVHFVDVGQGDAILIKAPNNKNLLIDTGNLSTAYRLKNYLKEQRVSNLKGLFITHLHPDHVGGLFCLLPEVFVENIYDNGTVLPGNDFYEEYINIIKTLRVKRQIVKEGDTMFLGNLVLQVLSPSEPLTMDLHFDCVVVKITYGNSTFLMTGDFNRKGEERLLSKGADLQSQVLKVGHHGAGDATSEAFLNKVNPEIAVLFVGKDNRYGYPSAETVERIKRKRIKLYRTDHDGTIVIRTDGENIRVKTGEP